jgi:hypothetical protein
LNILSRIFTRPRLPTVGPWRPTSIIELAKYLQGAGTDHKRRAFCNNCSHTSTHHPYISCSSTTV